MDANKNSWDLTVQLYLVFISQFQVLSLKSTTTMKRKKKKKEKHQGMLFYFSEPKVM